MLCVAENHNYVHQIYAKGVLDLNFKKFQLYLWLLLKIVIFV